MNPRCILFVAARAARITPLRSRTLHVEASKSSIMDAIAKEKVLVFSKTHCPYCARVKSTLEIIGAKYQVVELDTRDDGTQIQSLLLDLTGQRTVPNIFIGGKHIGGCDDIIALHAKSELSSMLQS
ncbi:putative glutaredoxin, Thioredoxin-like superfamily [Plasmopara halstedii]